MESDVTVTRVTLVQFALRGRLHKRNYYEDLVEEMELECDMEIHIRWGEDIEGDDFELFLGEPPPGTSLLSTLRIGRILPVKVAVSEEENAHAWLVHLIELDESATIH